MGYEFLLFIYEIYIIYLYYICCMNFNIYFKKNQKLMEYKVNKDINLVIIGIFLK